ncbi:MAG: hypothetical protein KAS63_01465 [Candidatus Heimdallarchaeota archaeon]|nr:hypothetical protein [Candidatus Heimdallarchaeota archaeon]MCK4954006.1 hypothetical protein [Candidatus Heimdallarchaeota archaeon]
MSTEKIAYEMPSDQEKKKWSFLGWGLLFLAIWTIALMFILQAALQPADSFVATIIAYALGLLGLGIFAGLTRSKAKVLLAILLLIVLFGAGALLHYLNAPIYNPLAPVSERVILLSDHVDDFSETELWENNVPAAIVDNMDQIKRFSILAFFIDLVIMIPIMTFGMIGLTWIIQIFTQKPDWMLLLSGFFALVFFILGMIIAPTIHLLVAGVLDLGTNISIGAFYMIDGFTVLLDIQNANQSEINRAVNSFNLASEWLEKGGEDIASFLWGLGLLPYGIGDAADDLNHLFQAVFILFRGVGPFANASFQIFQGFNSISQALNTSSGSILTAQGEEIKKSIDDDLFNQGIEYVNDGILQFSNSSDILDEALAEVQEVDWTDIEEALGTIPGGVGETVTPVFDQIEGYIDMFEEATGLIDVLISAPTFTNGTQSEYAALIHFFKGAYNVMKAAETIGDETNFVGTDVYFDRAGEHFNVTYNALNTPEVDALIYSDTPILNYTVAFLVDMTGLAAEISYFGGDLGPVLMAMNSTLSNFDSGYENVTDYSPILYDLDAFRNSTNDLMESADSLDTHIVDIQEKANNNTYGEFSSTAYEFATNFNQFNLTLNARNANAIAHSFYYLFSAMDDLKTVTTEVNDGNDDFYVPDYPAASIHFTAANNSLASAIANMESAEIYMNQTETGGMIQLSGSVTAIHNIRISLINVQSDMIFITNIAAGGSPSPAEIADVGVGFNNIIDSLVTVNTDLGQIASQ